MVESLPSKQIVRVRFPSSARLPPAQTLMTEGRPDRDGPLGSQFGSHSSRATPNSSTREASVGSCEPRGWLSDSIRSRTTARNLAVSARTGRLAHAAPSSSRPNQRSDSRLHGDESQAVVLSEVLVVLDVQRRQGKTVGQRHGCHPHVVLRARPATPRRGGGKLPPGLGNPRRAV